MAPSTTQGALIPLQRRAPTKVIVFQWPFGTRPTKRSPRTQRPLNRTIFVLAAVSSMKHQVSWIKQALFSHPPPARLRHVGALLLGLGAGFSPRAATNRSPLLCGAPARTEEALVPPRSGLRTGCEGRISVVKRRNGLNRCRYKSDAGIQRCVGLGIIADNLITIGRALAKPRAP
jgi:hypothetical protein